MKSVKKSKTSDYISILLIIVSLLIGGWLGEKVNFWFVDYLYNNLFWSEKISTFFGLVLDILIIIISVIIIWGGYYKLVLSHTNRELDKDEKMDFKN